MIVGGMMVNKYQVAFDFVKKSYPQGSKKWKQNIEVLQELIDTTDFDDFFYSRMLVGSNCEMLNLYVKDLDCNSIHKVGTNGHDTIYTFNNDVYYYNLQNGCGCSMKHKGNSYKFVKGDKNGK